MNQNETSVAVENNKGKVDLATSYLGLDLVSPVIIGSCPLNIEFEATRRMVEAGIGAIVLPSILQEQLIHRSLIQSDPISANEQSGHAPQQDRYNGGPQEYLKTIQRMKKEYDIPIIARMHGATIGSWLDYAVEIQESGADALELNWQIVETNTRDLHIPLAASGGVRTGDDVIETMIAGADVATIVSEIYRHGLDARPSYRMRSEIVDPLTSSSHYRDPTPVAKQLTGDCFGHPSH